MSLATRLRPSRWPRARSSACTRGLPYRWRLPGGVGRGSPPGRRFCRGPAGALTTEEREELGRLRRETRTLRMERDILKKATAFFARESA